jgi:hypothetical protein
MGLHRDRHSGTNPQPPRPLGPQPTASAPRGFWAEYLVGGYFDTDGHLRVEYVDREHMEPLAREMADDRLSSGQARRFFTHCRMVETLLKAHGKSPERLAALWAVQFPAFVRLDVFAADALAKQKVPKLFHDFIERNVNAVRTQKDFLEGFMPHFEALIGFGNAHFAKGERN